MSASPTKGARHRQAGAALLVAPALAVIGLFYLYPLGLSLGSAWWDQGHWSLVHLRKVWGFYRLDIVFSAAIVAVSTALIGMAAVAIAGYLTLGDHPRTVRLLRWLYRWPLFVPFIVAAQTMRTFLAGNGLLNTALGSLGLISEAHAMGLVDWRGIIVTFVWKQTPFAALMIAGAMASLDRSTIEAARNLGAGRLRVLVGIVLPQVRPSLMVALVLSSVTMMSVLSVPMMISANSPTMLTVDMAYRINSLNDYGTANALGLVACLMTGAVAWLYLRRGLAGGGGR